MNICEKCGKVFEVGTSSSRFCSKSCAHSRDQKKLKLINCFTCGKIAEISIHPPRHLQNCKECQESIRRAKYLKFRSTIGCQICGKTNCKDIFCRSHGKQQFKSLIKYFGFKKELLGTENCESEWWRVRNMLISDYWINDLTSSDIAKKYNYPSSCNIVGKIFNYLEIPRRNNSEATRLNYVSGKIEPRITTRFSSQWFDNWDGSKVFLRSSYELEVAEYLNMHKIKYKVEYPRFEYYNPSDNKIHAGLPDFYLPDKNLIIEVKSAYTIDVEIMKRRKQAIENLGYQFMLIYEHQVTDINSLDQPSISLHNRS